MAIRRFNTVCMLLVSVFLLGCSNSHVDLPQNTRMAMNTAGDKLLVSWSDFAGDHAKSITIQPDNSTLVESMALPKDTLSIAFALSSNAVLLTTWDGARSTVELIGERNSFSRLIYSGSFPARFPAEWSKDRYVFLEGERASGASKWKTLIQGKLKLLNENTFYRATSLNIDAESLYYLDGRETPTLVEIQGAVPPGIAELVMKNTYTLVCSEGAGVSCVRSNLTINLRESYSEIDLFSTAGRCHLAGHWKEFNKPLISRNGRTIAFHAYDANLGRRVVFFARNDGKCRLMVAL